MHEAQHISHAIGPQDLLLGYGTNAAVREGGSHYGNRLAVGLEGAALEVEVHALPEVGLLRVAAVLPHVEAQGVVTVGCLALRQKYGVVEAQVLTAGQLLEVVHGEVELLCQGHLWLYQGF